MKIRKRGKRKRREGKERKEKKPNRGTNYQCLIAFKLECELVIAITAGTLAYTERSGEEE
jgi:hypothetical protein